jgi:hypothetical protein
VNAYGALLRLYPRDFREEYGEDMTQLLHNQLRDESAPRVWARTVLDVALTVPSLRLEAHMSRGTTAPIIYGAASVACLVLAAVAGSTVGVSIPGFIGVTVFGALAFVAWRRSRTIGAAGRVTGNWWKCLVGGCAAVGSSVAFANLSGDELPEGTWLPFMGVLLAGVALIAAGLLLGVTRALQNRRGSAPATGG